MKNIAGEKSSLSVKLLTYESVVFFKLEYFTCMLAEVSCDLQRNDGRGHIATCLNEVDGYFVPRSYDEQKAKTLISCLVVPRESTVLIIAICAVQTDR